MTHSRALIIAARLSIAMCCIGFVAAFTPYRGHVGVLFPAGITLFWIVGALARRPNPPSEGMGNANPNRHPSGIRPQTRNRSRRPGATLQRGLALG